MLFHRHFVHYTGGHGKVWDYFRHARALGWDARVFLTTHSLRDERNPWMACPQFIEPEWEPDACDVLFLAGMDWAALADPRHPPRPVINLVQGVRHASPDQLLHAFLPAPAHRICVSQPVADALLATGIVNGPISVIPAALDLPDRSPTIKALPSAQMPSPEVPLPHVLVAALKAPELGRAVALELRQRGIVVELLEHWLPRVDYLARVAAASAVVALPLHAEGFYLPALEAMALGVPVVTVDCIGSRQYTCDGENCVLSAPEPQALAAAVEHVLQPERGHRLLRNGYSTAAAYGQQPERERFAQVIRSMQGDAS